MIPSFTPGFLRSEAVRQVIGAIHNAHLSGTWDLQSVETYNDISTLSFRVGTQEKYGDADQRPQVEITVREVPR